MVTFTYDEFRNLCGRAMWVCATGDTTIVMVDDEGSDTYTVYTFVIEGKTFNCVDNRTGLTYEGAIDAVQTQMFEENAHLAA